MKVASGLASGHHPTADLAEKAVGQALARAELDRAGSVLLLLTRDFIHQAQAAILAAARAAGSLNIFGCCCSGLFTENGWLLDQSGAAALVLEDATPTASGSAGPNLSFSNHSILPFAWQAGMPRHGLLESNTAVWAHGRLSTDGCSETCLPGWRTHVALSTGLCRLGAAQRVDRCRVYDLQQVAGQLAIDNLRQHLPEACREFPPLHHLNILRQGEQAGIAILSINADGSLTLAEAVQAGEEITWAIRQAESAAADMHQTLAAVAPSTLQPEFALMFSCIGRGPLFYGHDDRDLAAVRQRYPSLPLLGAYGTGQITRCGARNRLFQNSVVTLLFEGAHV